MACINFRNFAWNYVNVVLQMQFFFFFFNRSTQKRKKIRTNNLHSIKQKMIIQTNNIYFIKYILNRLNFLFKTMQMQLV